MWISRSKYDRIIERLNDLERNTTFYGGSSDTQLVRVVSLILDHLGLHVDRPLPYDRLVKKGGPERGS